MANIILPRGVHSSNQPGSKPALPRGKQVQVGTPPPQSLGVSSSAISNPLTPANPSATAGPTAINGSSTNFMRADAAPAIQLGSNTQKGLVQVDGTTITAVSGVISAAGPGGANPTATAGPSVVNGAATTFMRSDAAPAVQIGSASQKGIVQVDGTTITASSGVISAAIGSIQTWTPTDQSGAGLILTIDSAKYILIGPSLVMASFNLAYPSTSNGSVAQISLPQTPNGGAAFAFGLLTNCGTAVSGFINGGNLLIRNSATNANILNSTLSTFRLIGSFVYSR